MVCKCIQLLLSFKIMLFDHLGRKSGEIKGRGCAIISVHCSVVKEKSKQIQIPRKRLKSKKKRIFLIQNGTDYKISSHIEGFSTNGGWIFQLWHQFYLVSTGNLPSRWVLTNSCSNNQIWRFLIHFSKCVFVESFTRKQEYGLTILVSSDDKVNHFLESVLSQIKVKFSMKNWRIK